MVNFKEIVLETLYTLTEAVSSTASNIFATECKNKGITEIKNPDDLNFLYNQVKNLNTLSGKSWANKIYLFPVLFALSKQESGLQKLHNKIASSSSIDNFYENYIDLATKKLNMSNQNLIKSIDNYQESDFKTDPSVFLIFNQATAKVSENVLKQDVWEEIKTMTITDAISSLLKKRLTGLEQLALRTSFFPPLVSIREVGTFDKLVDNVVDNYQTYINGQTKYSKKISQTLYNINITPEDLGKVIGLSRNILKYIVTSKLDASISEPDPAKKQNILDEKMKKSFTNEYIKRFCKTGVVNYFDENDKLTELSDGTNVIVYDLQKIESLKSNDSTSLINLIRNMSTGIRVNDESFKKMLAGRWSSLVQGAGALAAFGGAKLYG